MRQHVFAPHKAISPVAAQLAPAARFLAEPFPALLPRLGVLFFLALVVTVFWAHACGVFSELLIRRFDYAVDHRVVFAIGMWCFVAASAVASVVAVTKAFKQFDLTQDMPQ